MASITRSGSSPRVRGKVKAARPMPVYSGIIPAGAGKSTSTSLRRTSPEDHPRGCGEKRQDTGAHGRALGSSPRVRGKVSALPFRAYALRIIPAGAGKSRRDRHQGQDRQDHPRGCGEKRSAKRSLSAAVGSSPRVRGKGSDITATRGAVGIIPAGAGKRGRSRCCRC